MTEGMQHIRIMEGMSRSLPSSPLLTHQTISMRLQPVKKLTGKDAARACDVARVQFSRISHITRNHLKGSQQILWAGRVWICSVQTSVACLCPPPNTCCTNTSWNSSLYYCRQRNGSTERIFWHKVRGSGYQKRSAKQGQLCLVSYLYAILNWQFQEQLKGRELWSSLPSLIAPHPSTLISDIQGTWKMGSSPH